MKTIKVLIVDDSIVFRQMLMRHFLNVPNIQIIGQESINDRFRKGLIL